MTAKEKVDDIIMHLTMRGIVWRAKRMYNRYGELRLNYHGALVAKNENVEEVYTLPAVFHKLYLPDNFREIGTIEDESLDTKSRNLICLINAISAKIKHMPKHCERYDQLWFLLW